MAPKGKEACFLLIPIDLGIEGILKKREQSISIL